ncbi:hypothetical protein QYE92_09610 [Enterobacter cloacae subsp. cloacae]|uniref:hypothetical protein n=1 Tax=Enterobacter cloacae complex TaxID=354276 RepID=UPI00079754EA|nr:MULTISPECIES: hypothetical protein [Enterobacter cloacae complex]MDR9971644.1 hypothetical protein [Enterobacter cloacae subsp. cloacae]MDS0085857.1 hypothetical protein [Enterobacter cloacae subsp. cloacae]MDV5380703.1 hypothetical protein [Enterobacter hormaechei]MDV5458752.1 hypothetical protein [Enterobacter hormaechei]SAG96716.1 Uncharacterised protein [Enterobacter hormaechei]
MVTRLSGTPSFAKSRLKKLIKAASGGLFFARQRVTTEGKAMACKCFTEVKERMVERVKEALGDAVHSMDECDFGNRVWVLEKGDYCQVMLPFNVRYRKRKKNGDPEQRLTNADTKLAINYCPFCGTKFEGKAA